MADGTAFTMVELKTTNTSIKEHYLPLGTWPANDKLPIVYSRNYNIAFYGLERWNSFDAWKLDRIFQVLVEHGLVREGEQPSPVGPVPDEILAAVHEASYLQQMNTSKLSVIRLTELPGLFLLPQFMIQRHIVTPLKYQVAGTVLALGIALERGWAIHLGGGMIHGSYNRGAGWCPFDDVSCAIYYARSHIPSIQRVMVIDLGAHQGNGYQNTKLHFQDEDLFIVDVYNEVTFPQDLNARKAINVGRSLPCGATTDAYLAAVVSALNTAAVQCTPDVILYIAGTNVLEEDYSGQFCVTRDDVYQRDRLVFQFAQTKGVPICMLVSSGYGKTNFEVVAESVRRLVTDLPLC